MMGGDEFKSFALIGEFLMKRTLLSLFALALFAGSFSAAEAQHHRHRVCHYRHGHRVCRWV
jgi:hypothetical protein